MNARIPNPCSLRLRAFAWLALALAWCGCGAPPGELEYQRALRAMGDGRDVAAKTLFENAINRRPGSAANATAYNYLGILCARLGQREEAMRAFEESRRLDPGAFAPAYNLGVLLYESGDLFRGATLLHEAALADVRDTRALEYLALIHEDQKAWDAAHRAWQDVLARNPSSPRAMTALARLEWRQGRAADAVAGLTRALEINPEYPPALYDLALVYQDHFRDPAQACAFYGQYLDRVSTGRHADLARAALAQLAPLARAAATDTPAPPTAAPPTPIGPGATPPPDATAAGTLPPTAQPLATPPLTPVPPREQIEILLRRAEAAGRAGKATAATADFLAAADLAREQALPDLRHQALKRALAAGPDQAEPYFAYGQYQIEQDNAREALTFFKRAIAIRPDWVQAYLELANTALESEEYDTALVALKKVRDMDPQNADAIWASALLYEKKMDLPIEAAQAYSDFMRQVPEDKRVFEARRRFNALQEQIRGQQIADKAEAVMLAPTPSAPPTPTPSYAPPTNRILRIPAAGPRNTRAAVQAYNRGTFHHSRSEWDQAIFHYQRAIENDAMFGRAYFNLGVAFTEKSDYDLARQAYAEAIRLQPDLVNARYNLAVVAWELRDYTTVEDQARQILQTEPANTSAHYLLGMVYARRAATHAQARQHYEIFLKQAPNDPAAGTVRRWMTEHPAQ